MTIHGVGSQLVQAAGAVCWRHYQGKLQLLLVHRPKYDDWSWPKGKLALHESAPVACVREVQEETGLTVALGAPLPAMSYTLNDNRPKHVSMWAAHVPHDAPTPPRPHEVDTVEWVDADEVLSRLTRRSERVQGRAVMEYAQAGTLQTWPLILVRTGFSYPRRSWRGGDKERPLVDAGHRQARDMGFILGAWGPEKVWCSPARRCVDTVRIFCGMSGTPLKPRKCLAEKNFSTHPQKVAGLVRRGWHKGKALAVCSSEPVLAAILQSLPEKVDSSSAGPANVPASLVPGEIFVAHISSISGQIVATESHVASSVQHKW